MDWGFFTFLAVSAVHLTSQDLSTSLTVSSEEFCQYLEFVFVQANASEEAFLVAVVLACLSPKSPTQILPMFASSSFFDPISDLIFCYATRSRLGLGWV